jgi:hypothetical protein
LAFRADPATRDAVVDLARREAACCAFLDYRIEIAADELVWTITNPNDAGVDVVLDAFYALDRLPATSSEARGS